MPKRSNSNLLVRLIWDVFKLLPPQVQMVILVVMALIGSTVAVVNMIPSKKNDPPPIVKSSAEFDPSDPERTCRWILASSMRTRQITRSVVNYKGSNPLRTDRDAEMEKTQADYKSIIQAKVGTRIVWPVLVDRINQGEVQIKLAFDEVEQDGIRAKVYMQFEDYPRGRETYRIDGNLKIGHSITLEQAKQLDEGAWLFVDGVIDSIDGSISSYSLDEGGVSINVKDCKAILLTPETQAKILKK